MKKFHGLFLALVMALPLAANARITREDLDLRISNTSDLIGRLRACSKFDQESMRFDNAAKDTELALYKYMRAPGLLTDTYPDVVAAKASVGLRIELGSLQYLRKTSPGEIQTTCDAIELEARQEIVFLLKDIIAHHKGKKR